MFRTAIALLLCGALNQTAAASLVYMFDQSNYNVAPNATVDVQVYLVQTDPTGDRVDLTSDGLVSGSVRVHFDETPPSDPAEVLNLSDITPNPQFDDTVIGAEFDLDPGVSAGFADGVDDIFSPLTGTSILLGTFRFTAGSVPGEVTFLRATDFRASQDTIAGDLDLTPLDGLITDGTATITVTPEPSTVLLMGVAASAAIACRRRRFSTTPNQAGS